MVWCGLVLLVITLVGLRGPTVGRNDSGRWLMVVVYHYFIRDKLDDLKVDDDVNARKQ